MKRELSALVITLTLAAAVAAATPRQSSPGVLPNAPPKTPTTISSFQFDLSALGAPPPPQLPAQPLQQQSLSPAPLTAALLQTQEQFAIVDVIGVREFYESTSWDLEIASNEGAVLALHKPHVVTPQQLNPVVLRADSLQRLAALGIGPDEIVDVLQRRLMAQDENSGQLAPPSLFRHKTFVLRGINGVEIEGHRAVVTHHLDGAVQRVFLNWPALAAGGHRLQTNVSPSFLRGQAYRKFRDRGHGATALEVHAAPAAERRG